MRVVAYGLLQSRLILGDSLASQCIAGLNIPVEFRGLNAPLTAAAHLNGGKLTASDESADLSCRDVEVLRDVGDAQELSHDDIMARKKGAG